MRKNFLPALVLVLITICQSILPPAAPAQIISSSQKQLASVDYGRLAYIDSLIDGYIRKQWLTGAVTLVVKDGQVVQYKGYGYADRESGRPMQKDAIFRIMSQTKAITSAAVLSLYDKGKIVLDEPVSNFIPEFKNPKVIDQFVAADSSYTTVPAKREITIRDLLTHTSGIDYAAIGTEKGKAIYAKAGIPSGLGSFDASLLEKMKALGKLPLVHQPGEKFTYGLNSDLLGCIVEIVSGMSLDAYFKKYIFDPLGMHDSYFNVPAAKSGRIPAVYTEDATHKIIPWSHTFRNIDPDYPTMEKHYFSGGAGLSSTAYDYAIFLQAIMNGGVYNGKRILSRRACELMTSGQLDFLYNGKDQFGLGFSITSPMSGARNARNAGSFAWGGYYGTNYWADPKEHLVCLIMIQQTPNSHSDLTAKFEAIVYSSLR